MRGQRFVFLMICMAGWVGAAPANTFRGVPYVALPSQGTDVEDYWASHPYNPANLTDGVVAVISPDNVVTCQPDQSIQSWVDSAPVEGRTIWLLPGVTYTGNVSILRRSNIHLRCQDETNRATVLGRLAFYFCSEAQDYGGFDSGLDGGNQTYWEYYRHPTTNLYFKNIDLNNPSGGHGCARVWHVLFDHCVFRSAYPYGGHHTGILSGNMGFQNIGFLHCRFKGNGQWAFYLDGAHCVTVVDCYVRLGNTSTNRTVGNDNGFLFLTNDDFTEGGTWAPFDKITYDEELNAKFNVVVNNTFEGGGATLVAVTGENLLFKDNVQLSGFVNNAVTWDSRSGSGKALVDPSFHYDHRNLKVLNNQVGPVSVAFVGINHLGADTNYPSWGVGDAQAYMGGFTICGNVAGGSKPWVTLGLPAASVPFWHGTNTVGGNCRTGTPGCNPNPAFAPDLEPPTAPTGLTVTNLKSREAMLRWNPATDNGEVCGYRLYRDGALLAGSLYTNEFTDLSLVPATSYVYVVRAFDWPENLSDPSAPLTVNTPNPDEIPPAVPPAFWVAVTNHRSLTLAWGPATDNVRVTGYEVQRSGQAVTAATTTNLTFAGLLPNTTYQFVLRSVDSSSNCSPWSAPLVITTRPVPVGVNLINNPSFETNDTSAFVVGWQKRAELNRTAVVMHSGLQSVSVSGGYANYTFGNSPVLDEYMVYTLSGWIKTEGVLGAGGYIGAPNAANTPRVTGSKDWTYVQLVFTNLTAQTVSARLYWDQTAGTTYFDDVFLGIQPANYDAVPPTVPTGLVCLQTNLNGATLAWQRSSDDKKLLGYKIYRDGAFVNVSATNGYVDAGLTPETRYVYQVLAYDTGGNNATSVSLIVDTPAPLTATGVPYPWLRQFGWTNGFDAAAAGDQDHDGLYTWEEYIAGTVPTNALSVFALTVASSNPWFLTWPAASGRLYQVERADSPAGGFMTVPGWGSLPAASNSVLLTNRTVRGVYRVGVRKPE